MKYAVYVEGQSELLFVADILQKYSNYDASLCGFKCINLVADNLCEIKYPSQGGQYSTNFYQIVNVNNDNRVISKLNKDIPNLLKNGFDIIIGLKDVYSETYEKLCRNPIVDRVSIEKMFQNQRVCIKDQGADCRLHFAIMEYEAWILALLKKSIDTKGSDFNKRCEDLKYDIKCDPELTIYHPTKWVREIMQSCGIDYCKSDSDSYSILSSLTTDDYEALRYSGRCLSFAKFLDSLLGKDCPNLP